MWTKSFSRYTRILLVSAAVIIGCLLYTSPRPRDAHEYRMPSSA